MRILLTGASGQLGSYVHRELILRGKEVVTWKGARDVDLAAPDQVLAALREARPTHIIHCGALASIAACFREPQRAERSNRDGTALLAEHANARLLHISTDLVFDGKKGNYVEEDSPAPLSVYALTKAASEKVVLARGDAVVVRVSLMFGPSLNGRPCFFDEQVGALREQRPITLFSDEWRTPLSLSTAARALTNILDSDITGILHLGGPERMSRLEMGQRLALYLGVDPSVIISRKRADMPAPEMRPRDVSLSSQTWRQRSPASAWPAWNEALYELCGR